MDAIVRSVTVRARESASGCARPAVDLGEEYQLRRAAEDAAVEPWALLKAVRDSRGRVIDFVYHDINRIAARQQRLRREDLLGRSVAESLPELVRNGILDLYVCCIETGEPLVLDDLTYFGRTLDAPGLHTRRYEMRGVRVQAESLSLNWRDINQRYVTEQQVAESEERYRLLAENSSDVVSHVRDGRFVWVSPSVDDVLGAPPEHWLGRAVLEILPPGDASAHAARWKALSQGYPIQQRVQVVSVDGISHWVHLHAKPFYDAEGHQDGVTASFRVVDDEVVAQQAAEKARHQQAEVDALLRASSDSMLDPQVLLEAIRDASGRVVDFGYASGNRAACSYLGVTEQALIGCRAQDTLPNLEGSGLLARYAQCLADGEPVVLTDFSYFNEIIDDDRRYDICATRAGPDLLTLSWTDVTDRFHAAQRIASSERAYRLLAENSSDMVTHVRDGRFAWISPSVGEVVGAPPEYWVGRQVREILPPEDASAFADRLATLAAGGSIQERIRVVAVDGVIHWIDLHARPFYDDDGHQDGVHRRAASGR